MEANTRERNKVIRYVTYNAKNYLNTFVKKHSIEIYSSNTINRTAQWSISGIRIGHAALTRLYLPTNHESPSCANNAKYRSLSKILHRGSKTTTTREKSLNCLMIQPSWCILARICRIFFDSRHLQIESEITDR